MNQPDQLPALRAAFEKRYKLKSRAAVVPFMHYSNGWEDGASAERARADALQVRLDETAVRLAGHLARAETEKARADALEAENKELRRQLEAKHD